MAIDCDLIPILYAQDYGVNVAVLATDRHPQIKSMMKNKYPTVDHQFDVWHMAKSITKQLNAASKRRECEDLRPWIKSITNHFWWASDTCGGSTVQLKVNCVQKNILFIDMRC